MTSDYESNRLFTLRQLNLLDTPPSESFDRITRMASRYFDLPVAAVSLSDEDRQWFKSRVGVEHWEIPRFKACCGEVSDTSEVVVVNDLLESPCYQDSVLADSGIRFYAGAPLTTRDGYTLGAMCVLGQEPRTASEEEIAVLRDMAAMVMAQIELQHAVGRVDAATGLPNYNQLVDDLDDAARDAPGEQRYVLNTELIDVTEANRIQGVMGPSYLDELAHEAGRLMREALGPATNLYLVGTGKFAHLLSGDQGEVMRHARAVREALTGLTVDGTAPFMLRPVVGIAPFQLGEIKPHDVLRMAHTAARDARKAEMPAGLYSPESDASHQRSFNILARFQDAVAASDQLYLRYQPRVAIATGECVGVEALVRWTDPVLGPVSPGEFIPLVENTSFARELTDWVLRDAVRQAAEWKATGRPMRVSVNIASANLEEDDFADRVLGYLARAGLDVGALELELTEGSIVSTGQAARSQLDALIDAGITIAIDDFGTGYSSLAYLQDLPAQVVKIDRSFIDHIEDHPRRQTLVRSMVDMAHQLGYAVVAEGIETAATYRFLSEIGCEEAQGFYLAKPLLPAELDTWLTR
jgi:EAL domain-containing protein (putative c-di-GMP-specific phosphodiesterase class I)